jgi:bifunctional non-homologous end joining protein LigD
MPLEEYRRKRKAGATPEPFGGGAAARPHLFVVQKHAATSLHYDLRLEWKGVLLSWAVPKGPSSDPATKRLAMRVEDHPVEYADFEGTIPEGNYGAGQVIVWDIGSYVPLEEMGMGLGKGKLLFELRGQKLGGRWTLFRTAKDERQWLLVRSRTRGRATRGRRSRCSPGSRSTSCATGAAARRRSRRRRSVSARGGAR